MISSFCAIQTSTHVSNHIFAQNKLNNFAQIIKTCLNAWRETSHERNRATQKVNVR